MKKSVIFKGSCASGATYEVSNRVIVSCVIHGGCLGNTQGVSRLIVGRTIDEVIPLLKGILCRNGTSCPDQLARALEADFIDTTNP